MAVQAQSASKISKDGFLSFEAGDLLVVVEEDGEYFAGRNTRTGRQGLFKKELVVHCSKVKL